MSLFVHFDTESKEFSHLAHYCLPLFELAMCCYANIGYLRNCNWIQESHNVDYSLVKFLLMEQGFVKLLNVTQWIFNLCVCFQLCFHAKLCFEITGL
jgi:hypothetical protein